MGRKLDLSSLTEEEAEHVLQVVQRDMRLRKTEEERLSDLKQELDEEDSRCVLLSRQCSFNQRCCIRCCSPFTFLLKPRRRCLDCHFNVCKRCCSYSTTDKGWLCSACEKSRLLKTRSLEWFYSNVRRRFKRFGSAKVLKTLYRRHIAEQGSLAELTEGSTYDESVGNGDSVYESDSTFYKHSEEHSMAETIGVALRVAEEAIDEAIAKAESQRDNQEKLKEACYLRDNRGELIEELTTTIVQKIIRRKTDQSEMQPEHNPNCCPDHKSDVSSTASPTNRPRSALASQPSPKTSLWRSRSALSLFTDEMQHQHGKPQQRPMHCKDCTQGLTKDGISISALPNWKSVDRLDNSMLQSSDGNWIALQSTQLSRPSLLTKRKSLVFSALEKESGVVSAYDGMGSDTEPDSDGTWCAALLEIRNKMSSNNVPNNLESTSPQATLKSPTQPAADQAQSDSGRDTRVPKFHKSPFPFLKRKVPLECKRSSSQRLSVMDINFNPEGTESSEDGLEDSRVKRTRRRRRSKREDAEKEFTALCSAEPDYSRILLDVLVKHRNKRQGDSEFLSDQTMDTTTSDIQSSEAGTPDAFVPELEKNHVLSGSVENKLTSTLRELANQVSETQFSSTEDELDRVEEIGREGNDNAEDGRGEALWDMEVDAEKEEPRETEEGEEQKAFKKFLKVEISEVETVKKVEESQKHRQTGGENVVGPAVEDIGKEDHVDREFENSGTLTTDIIGHLHNEIQEPVDKQSESEMEKSVEIPQGVCLDHNSMRTGQLTELGESEIDNLDNTNAEGQVKTTEDIAGCTTEIINEEEIEEEEEDRSEGKDRDDTEPEQEKNSVEENTPQEPESLSETEQQRQTVGERPESGQPVKGQEIEKQMKETESMADNGEDSLDDTASERKETEQDSDNHDLSTFMKKQEEVEYEIMLHSAVRTLNNMEEEIEAHNSNMRFSTLEDTEKSEEEEEIVAEERGVEEMTHDEEIEDDIEVGQDKERTSRSEQALERFMEKDSQRDLVEKTEEHTCVVKAEECKCKDHILKEDLDCAIYSQEVFLTPEEIYKGNNLDLEKDLQFLSTLLQQKYTAASLRSITTEVLKVLNATEDLIQGTVGDGIGQSESRVLPPLPPAQSKRLDEQLCRLEENVYVAASAVFGLEAELGDLEECARSISGATSEGELAHLEEQVASVAAQVQQSELQVSDIAARIAALKSAGLNVDPQTRFAKPQTIDSSRQHRRRLPAPPMQDKKA